MPVNNSEIDKTVEAASAANKFVPVQNKIVALGAGEKAARAAATAGVLAKKAPHIQAVFNAVEAARLVGSEDLRDQRVKEVEESAKKQAVDRMGEAYLNPIGTIYGAGKTIADTVLINAGQSGRDEAYELERDRVMKRRETKEAQRVESLRDDVRGFDPFNNRVNVEPMKRIEEDDKGVGLALVRSYFESNNLV
jgi:hypothetical protein